MANGCLGNQFRGMGTDGLCPQKPIGLGIGDPLDESAAFA